MKLKIKTSRDFDLPKDEPEDPLFSRPKGGGGRFVMRHGKLVPKHHVNNYDDIDDKRSDAVPAPMLAPRFPEHRNMATGEMITDRRHHRETLKRHGLTEVGNEYMPGKRPDVDRNSVLSDIKETIEQYEQGYDFRNLDLPDDGGDIGMGMDDHAVDITRPDDPQYTRTNANDE